MYLATNISSNKSLSKMNGRGWLIRVTVKTDNPITVLHIMNDIINNLLNINNTEIVKNYEWLELCVLLMK